MGMDNHRLARAIVALYATASKNDEWTDADEAINDAAFLLWQKSDAQPETMAELLIDTGLDADTACALVDLPVHLAERLLAKAAIRGRVDLAKGVTVRDTDGKGEYWCTWRSLLSKIRANSVKEAQTNMVLQLIHMGY